MTRGGVVLITEQYQAINHCPDPAIGSLNERQPQVPRRVIDPEKILRETAIGSDDDDTAGVRVLIGDLVIGVAKADRACETFD